LYNIAYGGIGHQDIQDIIDDPDQADELIHRCAPAAKRSQIHPFIMTKQKGYWEQVGERGLKLSGGER